VTWSSSSSDVSYFLMAVDIKLLPACTYVQRGSTICFVVVVLLVLVLVLVLVLLLGTLVRILQYIQN
jgi:hypothetical protein